MTISINQSFETSHDGYNNCSRLIISDRDYTMDRKLTQFKRLSKTLEALESNLFNLERKCKRKRNKKRAKVCHNRNTNKNTNDHSLKMDNCHANLIKFDNEKFTYVSSTSLKNDINTNTTTTVTSTNKSTSPLLNENQPTPELEQLKSELIALKEDNYKLQASTASLKQEIDELNKSLLNKTMKSEAKSNESFEKIDNTFIEMNKILNDLSHTKLLLQKTRNLENTKEDNPPIKIKSQVTFETKPKEASSSSSSTSFMDESSQQKINDTYLSSGYSPIIKNESRRSSSLNRTSLNLTSSLYLNSNKNIDLNSTVQTQSAKSHQEKRFLSNLKVNPLIDLNYKIDRLKSSLYPVELRVGNEPTDTKEEDKTGEDMEAIRKDLEKAQSENVELKKKIADVQKCIAEKGKQSELWKSMYDRLLKCLPESKVNIIRSSIQIDQPSIDQSDLDGLNRQIKQLSDDNLSLKLQLENLKQQNIQEIEKINAYKQENEKLKAELDRLVRESETNAKARFELNNQIEVYRNKLRTEEVEKEEIKARYITELNAAKIRYENELEKQNKLMNLKYDNLISETNQLNLMVNSLQQEKNDLVSLIQREVTLRKEINEHKEAINRRSVDIPIRRTNTSSSSNIHFTHSFMSGTTLSSSNVNDYNKALSSSSNSIEETNPIHSSVHNF